MDGMKWYQDTALPTTFSEPHAKRACLFASVLSILVQPTLSMMVMDGWMAFDMVVTRSSNNFASKHRRRGSI